VGDTLRHAGTAVHAYLARIAKEPAKRWTDAGIRAMLRNLGVAPAELDAAHRLVSQALNRTINDARGRWLLKPHAEAESELAIGGVSNGEIYEVVIDRTFIDENGVRWVIDYKTSAHSGGSVEQFLANEKRRYQEQLERYARLLGQRETRPIRLGLYFPLVEPSWIEWEAPNVLPRQASLFASAERRT
jgi:ATP-dependent exoDNAse (exonuclease V) beta subunit